MEKQIGDMYLASALLAYGASLVRIDRTNSRRLKFCFTGDVEEVYVLDGLAPVRVQDPTLDDVEARFISRTLMFPPDYPGAIRRIKAAIHSED